MNSKDLLIAGSNTNIEMPTRSVKSASTARRAKRTSIEVARDHLESLKIETHQTGAIDEETVRDMEERIRNLEEH